MTKRYKLTIEYDGTNYCGFQKQFGIVQKSVEEALEKAIFLLSQEQVKIIACGRTDTGVHALGQVVHFDMKKNLKTQRIVLALNNYLREENIVALNCEVVDENFHARFNAKMRHYRYVIINRTAPLVLRKNRAWHIVKKLDLEKMQEAANFLVGEHDFSSFRDAECQGKTPIKSIHKITITKNGDEVFIDISAKSFLHHMVRNIVGTLFWVGSEKILVSKMKEILDAKDRTKSGPNAPACGLYFLEANY